MLRYLLLCIFSCALVSSAPSLLKGDPDKNRLTFEYAASRGFIDEFHSIYSNDGYQTGIHRIVNPLKPVTRYPVLFLTVVGGASVLFLRAGEGGYVNESVNTVGPNIGFEMAKRGYDVWLLDWRGTYFYSYNHTKYNIDHDIEYWDFSEDELAFFDLSAAIDYIRSYTNRQKIGLFTFQGSTKLYVSLASFVNRFNANVAPVVALGPVFSLANTQLDTSMDRTMADFLVQRRGQYYPQAVQLGVIASTCNTGIVQIFICNPFIYFILLLYFPQGHLGSVNIPRLSVYPITGYNHGVSSWVYAQLFRSELTDQALMLDINPEMNMERYGSIQPPEYFPEKVTNSEMHFIYAPYDLAFDAKDVQILKDRLASPLRSEVVIPIEMSAMSYLDGESEDVIKWVNIPALNIFSAYQ